MVWVWWGSGLVYNKNNKNIPSQLIILNVHTYCIQEHRFHPPQVGNYYLIHYQFFLNYFLLYLIKIGDFQTSQQYNHNFNQLMIKILIISIKIFNKYY